MEHTMLPENNCPMLKEGLCLLSLEDDGPLSRIEQLQIELRDAKTYGELAIVAADDTMKLCKQLRAELNLAGARHDASCHDLLGNIDKLEKQRSQLQAELDTHRWIPVSERLPRKDECDNVSFIAEGLAEVGEFKNGLFWDNNGLSFVVVTHWRPIILP